MMKKPLFVLLCFTVMGIGPTILWASSPGNPLSVVGQGRLGVSAEWEHQNRNLELDVDSEVISNRYWLKGTYGLFESVDISAAVGMVDFDVSASEQGDSYSYENHHLTFGVSGGLKLRAYHDENREMAGFLKASGTHLKANDFDGSNVPTTLTWNELRFSAVLSKTYGFAVPYIGVSYSLVDGNLDLEGDISQDFSDPGGLALGGIDFSLPSLYVLSIELGSRLGGSSDEIFFSVGLSQRSK